MHGKWKSGPNSISYANTAYYSLPGPQCWMEMICEILLYVIKLILEQILDQTKSAMGMKFEKRDGDLYENYWRYLMVLFSF